jgi:copper chaperone CopZ
MFEPCPSLIASMVRLSIFALVVAACSRDDAQTAPEAPAVAAPQVKTPPRPANLAHVTIKALGMTCEEECPMRVRYALTRVPSVYELGFDLDHESVFVSFDATLGTPKEVTRPMLAAIKSVGYDPWLAKESWPADASVQVIPR